MTDFQHIYFFAYLFIIYNISRKESQLFLNKRFTQFILYVII